MNTNKSDSTTNPRFCTIRRVINGWILSTGDNMMGYEGEHHVFTTPAALAKFIEDNFSIHGK